MSDIIYRLTKGTELTFGELDRNFGSLDSDVIAANGRIDNLQAASGIDSAQAILIIDGMVDSAYVQLRQIDSLRDSAFITNIVDSEYVTSRADIAALGLMDSNKVMTIIDSHVDSEYIKFIADSDYVKSAANRQWIRLNADSDYVKSAADSDWIKFVADSNYVQSAADSDYIKLVVDSAYLTHVIDSDYVISITGIDSARVVQLMESDAQHILPAAPEAFDLGGNLRRWRAIYTKDLFVSPATIYFGDTSNPQQSRISLDSTGDFTLISPSSSGKIATSETGNALDSSVVIDIVDSAYVQARQTRPRMIAGGRIMISSIFSQNSATQKQLFGIFDSQQAPGGADGVQRISSGVYRFQFDSTNLSDITSSDDYAVTATLDYGYDNPTASSRTISVFTQRDSSFQLIIERADDGANEDYSTNNGHMNFQVWLY